MYSFEEARYREGYTRVAGIDEAGRGPLAGPVVAACVILPTPCPIEGIQDSKKLSGKKRVSLYGQIIEQAVVGVGIISEKMIDEINIYQAAREAMRQAVLDSAVRPDYLLIDGPMRLELAIPSEGIIGGDRCSASIAAASIIAKVTRDDIMYQLHEAYSAYGFDKHKGYPTKEHRARLEEFGPSPIHRLSFGPVKKMLHSPASIKRMIQSKRGRVRT